MATVEKAYAAKVAPHEAQEILQQSTAFLLDVRGLDEVATGRAPQAVCIPLSDLERRAAEIPVDRPVLVMCQSGGRSAMAVERLRARGMQNITDVDGGFNAWRQAGLPVVKETNVIPLERQVRIAAGGMVLGFSLAGFLIKPFFFWGAALIGFMLALTGTLGICPMMSLLKLLPWNRVNAACPK